MLRSSTRVASTATVSSRRHEEQERAGWSFGQANTFLFYTFYIHYTVTVALPTALPNRKHRTLVCETPWATAMARKQDYDHLIKLLLIGDSGKGDRVSTQTRLQLHGLRL